MATEVEFKRVGRRVTFKMLHRGLAGGHDVSVGIHEKEARKEKLLSNGDRDPEVTLGEVAHRNHDGDDIIPSRPWLSVLFSKHQRIREHIKRHYRSRLRNMANGGPQVMRIRKEHDKAAEAVGKKMVKDLRQALLDDLWGFVRNAPRTQQAKGFDHPLVDSGELAKANKSKVKRTR